MDLFILKVVLTAANKWKQANIENNLVVFNHHKNSQAIRTSRLTPYGLLQNKSFSAAG